jgi:type IV pilus assembly protein PilC
MATFKYRVRTAEGTIQAGVVDAPDAHEATAALNERGFEILVLEPFQSHKLGINRIPLVNRITPRDIVVVSRTLSVMISASVPLVDALKNIARQTVNPNLRTVMTDVATEVEAGARLSDALERHPRVFSGFFVNLVRSGETSGQLEQVLEYLAEQQEKDYDLTSKIRGALIYPAFIVSALGAVGFIMMTFVVPKLTQILEDANVPLPISTKILIVVSGFFESYWWLVILLVVGIIAGIRFAIQTPGGRLIFDKLLLKTPVFNRLLERIYVVRFCRSLATLLKGGVEEVGALEIVAGVIGNQVWKKMVYETIKEVNEGNSITTAFLRNKHVPAMMNQMLAVGEETGKLQEVLQRVAAFFSREVDNLVANLVTLIEPIVMILLGLGVGVMVSAILLPLYQLSTAI